MKFDKYYTKNKVYLKERLIKIFCNCKLKIAQKISILKFKFYFNSQILIKLLDFFFPHDQNFKIFFT